MSITVSLSERGSVGLRANTQEDQDTLFMIPYLVFKDDLFCTWWPYLVDLKRDLVKSEVHWSPSIKKNLKFLISKRERDLEGDDQEVLDLFAIPPYKFQMKGIHFGVNVERALIADATGLGKTIQAIGVLLVAMARGLVRRAIILCPSGLKMQWYEEIHEFAKNPPDTFVVHSGSPGKRKELYRSNWEVLITSPALFLRDVDQFREIEGVDYVAVDEASMIRNPEADISITVKRIFKKARFRLALTATPVENGLKDLYSVFEFVDRRVFMSQMYFNLRYVNWVTKQFTVKRKTKRGVEQIKVEVREPESYKNLKEVSGKIRSCYIRRQVSDVGLELPELIVRWEVLKMPPRQQKVYDAIRETTIGQISDLRGEALLVPLQGLRQACNSVRLVLKGETPKRPGEVKLERLKELLRTEMAGEQVIVFTSYERFASIMAREFTMLGEEVASYTGAMNGKQRQREIAQFQVGDRRILVATEAAERGHNLQNASIVVNVDLPWNPAVLSQRLGRVRRLKSKHSTVRMINMVCRNTVEETLIMKKIYRKRKTFATIFGQDELTQADPLGSMLGSKVRGLL